MEYWPQRTIFHSVFHSAHYDTNCWPLPNSLHRLLASSIVELQHGTWQVQTLLRPDSHLSRGLKGFDTGGRLPAFTRSTTDAFDDMCWEAGARRSVVRFLTTLS